MQKASCNKLRSGDNHMLPITSSFQNAQENSMLIKKLK